VNSQLAVFTDLYAGRKKGGCSWANSEKMTFDYFDGARKCQLAMRILQRLNSDAFNGTENELIGVDSTNPLIS